MLLGEQDQLIVYQMLLHFALDDSPKSFYRIQLRTVRRQEHQVEVQVLSQFSDFFRMMARMVIEHYENSFIGVSKRFPQ